ncbi:MAG: nuoM [Thermoleophilia bacterium]|nr:nuoM [Thermoleophilia bacterium]
MGDHAFSIPTLLIIVPVAGGLVAMSMLTRRAAAITSLVTFVAQTLLLIVSAISLDRYRDQVGDAVPSCSHPVASDGANAVLAQCNDWFPQWGVQYHVAVGWAALGLIALTSLVTVSASLFAWWADRPRPAPLHGLLWLTAAAITGLFLSRDLVIFYVCFELMLVPLLVLVGVWGGERRVQATLTMFIYTLLGSLPMLVGVLGVGHAANRAIEAGATPDAHAYSLPVLAQLAGSGDLHAPWWVLASFVLAFAIKAPLIPFHGWMPLTYREAPIEVTAVLSGLISKAAFFGFFVVVLPLFPGLLDGGWGTALTWGALASLIFGSLAAFRQPDLRGVVAYSSLAQMGLIVLGLLTFTGSGSDQGLSGAYLQSLNHGLISAGMFLLIGIIEVRTGERTFARLGGLATGRPRLLTIALVLTMLTLAVPGASSFAGELLILTGVFRGQVSGPLVATIGALAVVLAAMYALRLVAGGLQSPDVETAENARAADVAFDGDLRTRELWVVLPVVLALLTLSVWPNLAHRAMRQPPVAVHEHHDSLLAAAATSEDAR